MSCLSAIKIIQPEQCIGNSLSIINENFAELKDTACENLDRIVSLEQIETQLSNDVISLSSIVVPGVAKAWVKFDGTLTEANQTGPGFRKIYSKYNIDGVQTYQNPNNPNVALPGFYRVDFGEDLNFENTNYAVLGTSSETIVNSKYTWLQPVEYTESYVVVKVTNTDGLGVDAKHVSVIIF
jgi:hypothetical protein